jgi:radical SAM protein with 4Fe4S-binding SPASM domain
LYKGEQRHKILDYEIFEKLCEDLKYYGEEEVKVIYLGCFGEPSLNPRMTDMIHLLKSEKICREVRILTNGYLLSHDLNEQIVQAGADIVRISIEALTSEGYKKICGIKLDYDKFLSNIKDLYIRSRGTGTQVFAKLISTTLKGDEDLLLFDSMYSEITDACWCENATSCWPLYKSDLYKVGNAEQFTYDTVDEAIKHVCSYPLTHLAVFSDGSVGACCSDWRMDNVIGDIRTQSLRDIWNGEALHTFRRKLLSRQRATASAPCKLCIMRSPDDIDEDAEEILELLERK